LRRFGFLKTFGLVLTLVTVYVFIFGESGILERITLEKKKDRLMARMESLREEERQLRHTLGEYSGGRIPETEFFRSGFIGSEKKVLALRGISESEPLKESFEPSAGEGPFRIYHFRILWIVVSMIVLLFYFTSREKSGDDEKNGDENRDVSGY
jgi:hypothetical protein